MKKNIITGIVITSCVALYAAVWPRSAEDKVIHVTPEKPSVSAGVAATQEEPMQIIFSADTQSPDPAETEESTSSTNRRRMGWRIPSSHGWSNRARTVPVCWLLMNPTGS